jgi:plasmid stabilization system protein ParE
MPHKSWLIIYTVTENTVVVVTVVHAARDLARILRD